MFKQKQNMKINLHILHLIFGDSITQFYDLDKFYFEIDKTRVYYFKLHKVFETKDYFYLYLDEDTAFLVSKSGFKLGTPKDFSEFIKKKCIFKYSKEK